MRPRETRLEQLTRKEAWSRIQSSEAKLAILPTGSIEQHLTHLAMIHDIQSACMVAEDVADRVYPSALVAAPIQAGVSEHHMEFRFGSVTMKPATFQAALWDACDSFVRHGIENILILNGHGGNIAPMEGSVNQYRRYFQKNIHFKSYWDFVPQETAETALETGEVPGHAQEYETSMALYMFPENVRMDEKESSPDPGVRAATAEKGERLYNAMIEPLTEFVKAILDGRAQAELTGL